MFLEDGDFDALSENYEGGRDLTFTGYGLLSYFHNGAIPDVARSANAGPHDNEWLTADGSWLGAWGEGTTATGAIVRRLIYEAALQINEASGDQLWPQITQSTIMFGEDDSDSNATPIQSDPVFAPIGQDLLEGLQTPLRNGGLFLRLHPDLTQVFCYLRSAYGNDKTGTSFGAGVVRFQGDTNILVRAEGVPSAPRRSFKKTKAKYLIVGTGNNREIVTNPDPPAYNSYAGLNTDSEDSADYSAIGTAEHVRRNAASDVVRFAAKTGTTPNSGFYTPRDDVDLGDLCTLDSGGSVDFDWDDSDMQLAAHEFRERDGGGFYWVPEFGGIYTSARAAAIAGALGGVRSGCRCIHLCGPAINILLGTAAANIKVSGEGNPTTAPRELAVDGSDSLAWSEGVTDEAIGVADAYWAGDLGVSKSAQGYRIVQLGGGTPTIQNVATEVRIYSSDSGSAWSWLTDESKISGDPASNGWTLAATYTGPLELGESGLLPMTEASGRYWLFWAVTGGTADWDVHELELWTEVNGGTDDHAARCDHGHTAAEIMENNYGDAQAAFDAIIASLGSSEDFLYNTGGGKGVLNIVASAGASQTIDLADGNGHDVTLDAASCAIAFDGATASTVCIGFLRLRQDGTGGRLATWDASISFASGSAPTLTTDANAYDDFTFVSLDGGTTWTLYSGAGGSSVGALDDLSDVTITSPAENDQLQRISGEWVNNARRWEPVTSGGEIVFDGDGDVVMSWADYG